MPAESAKLSTKVDRAEKAEKRNTEMLFILLAIAVAWRETLFSSLKYASAFFLLRCRNASEHCDECIVLKFIGRNRKTAERA